MKYMIFCYSLAALHALRALCDPLSLYWIQHPEVFQHSTAASPVYTFIRSDALNANGRDGRLIK